MKYMHLLVMSRSCSYSRLVPSRDNRTYCTESHTIKRSTCVQHLEQSRVQHKTLSAIWWKVTCSGTRISDAICSNCGGTGSFATFGFKKYCKKTQLEINKKSVLLKYLCAVDVDKGMLKLSNEYSKFKPLRHTIYSLVSWNVIRQVLCN